jgi:hypothetical protein
MSYRDNGYGGGERRRSRSPEGRSRGSYRDDHSSGYGGSMYSGSSGDRGGRGGGRGGRGGKSPLKS